MEDLSRISQKEKIFLSGRKSRLKEFKMIFSVFLEFFHGIRKLHFSGPCITVYGSARLQPDSKYYKEAEKVGVAIAKLGFTVMTGGGPGIMEAACKGAKSANGKAIGCNISLPHEQHENAYLDKAVEFNYFFVRKVMLSKYAYAFIALPGGFGTFDELFEALTLIQTRKTKQFPVVLFGKEYYAELYKQMQFMAEAGTIDKKDLDLFLFTEDVDESIAFIESKVSVPKKTV